MQFQIDNIYGAKRQLLINGTVIEIKNNAVTMITGKNGTGKTLLLNKMFELCLQEGISAEYVEQSNKFILANASISENVAMSTEESDIKKAEKFLNENGMGHLISHKPKELSGGEKRIICLLRGLFSKSKVVFIDEPTNDLDFSAVETIKSLLCKIKSQKTIIIVSHDDRIKTIADNIINIRSKKINHFDTLSTKSTQEKENNIFETSKKDLSILLKKCCKRNILSNIIVIIFAFLSIYSLFLYLKGFETNNIEIADDEINIFTPMSQLSIDITDNGAIPIRALSCFDDSLSLKEKLDIYTTSFDKSYEMPINYGLNIEDNANYNVFELEYYDTINKEYFYTLDNYKELFGINIDENIDTGKYFVLGGIEEPKSNTIFSVDKFEESKNNLIKRPDSKSLECTFIAINLKTDESFADFISTESISKLMNGNFYIRSAETIKLTENLKSFQNIKNVSSFLIYLGIILFIADIIVTLGCLFSNKLVLRLFRNTGMAWREIYNITIKQYTAPLFRVVVVIISIIVNIGILLFKNIPFTFGSSISVIFMIIFSLLSYKVIDFISKKYIKGICNWRHR